MFGGNAQGTACLSRCSLCRPKCLSVLRLGRARNGLSRNRRLSQTRADVATVQSAVRNIRADCRIPARLRSANPLPGIVAVPWFWRMPIKCPIAVEEHFRSQRNGELISAENSVRRTMTSKLSGADSEAKPSHQTARRILEREAYRRILAGAASEMGRCGRAP